MSAEDSHVAEIKQIFGRTGPGGAITMVQMQLVGRKRVLNRAVHGSVMVGDLITIRDDEREHKIR